MMRLSRGARALVWGIVVSLLSSAAFAQAPVYQPTATSTPIPIPTVQGPVVAPTAVASVLEQGRTLETQRRWAEAFALYEDTARLNYGQTLPELEQRLDVAKMHFDIGRRYADGRKVG